MPEAPAGFFGGVPYVFKLFVARRQRRQLAGSLRREIAAEERSLADLLRQLGERAGALDLRTPATEGELQALRSLEQERAQIEAGKAEVAARLGQAEELHGRQSADCSQRIKAAEEQIAGVQSRLQERNSQLRAAKAGLSKLDKELKGLAGQRDARVAQAAKRKDPQQRADLEQAAAEIAVEIGDREKERETVGAEVRALEGPISELNATLAEWRTRLAEAQRELASARQTLATTKREVAAEERAKTLASAQKDQEITARLGAMGRILDQNPGTVPALQEVRDGLAATRARIGARQGEISRLEAERESYDRVGAKRGKVLLLAAGLALTAIVVLLVILLCSGK
jgi:chromosome segregation ATPase